MGLKINFLDANRVSGTLDGAFPFSAIRNEAEINVSVAGWSHDIPTLGMEETQEMRAVAYLGLARFREHQKGQIAQAA